MNQQTIAKATPRARADTAIQGASSQVLTRQALLDDMEAYRKKVSATPEAARAFLTRLGVLTRTGKARKLIRD